MWPCAPGVRLLFRTRKLIGWLALCTLLTSNLLGWIHFASHASGCKAECGSVRSVACCHHSHAHCCDPQNGLGDSSKEFSEATSDGRSSDSSDGKEQQPPTHDSDKCSICQNYMALRFGLTLPSFSVQWQADVVTELRFYSGPELPEPIFIHGPFYRGPPA